MRGLVWTLSVLFLLSLATNVFFVMGKGVHITNRYEQHQNQQQAQLVLGTCSAQGQIRWKLERPEEVASFLDSLSPEQALFAKVLRSSVLYPEFQPVEQEPAAIEEPPPSMSGKRILDRR